MSKWYVVGIALFIALGCSRKSSDSSTFQFTTPAHPDVSAKSLNTSMSQAFCYMVNVSGPGIAQIPNTCAPTDGQTSGFIEPSTLVSMEVPRGAGRTIEIFGYIPANGRPCSEQPKFLSQVPLNRVFLMAKKTGVSMEGEITTENLTVVFPGVQNHYGRQASMAASCYAGLPPIPGSNDSSSPIQVGNSYRIHSKISSGTAATAASGSSYRITGGTTHVAQ